MNLDAYLAAIRDDADRMAVAAESGQVATPISACPGWDLRALVMHTGGVHRWAAYAIEHAGPPTELDGPKPSTDADGAELGAWMRSGADALTEVLAATPLDADTWHPFPLEQKAWVWGRRQAMETMMHRWDAEAAVTGSSSLDAGLAAVGLAEFFEMLLPRAIGREGATVPDASLHVHCTDAGLADDAGEYIVWGDGGDYRMEATHRKGDAALRGSAEHLLLVMMGRADLATVDLVGDRAAVDAWFALPGL